MFNQGKNIICHIKYLRFPYSNTTQTSYLLVVIIKKQYAVNSCSLTSPSGAIELKTS